MSKMTSEKAQRHVDSLYKKKKLLDNRIETSYSERVKDEEIQQLKYQNNTTLFYIFFGHA